MYDSTRTILLVALVGLGAVAAPVGAASSGSITASPATAGETSTHTVTVTVGSDATGSLNGLAVDYSDADADISNVGVENVVTVGIDRDDDSAGDTIDENVSDDLDAAQGSNNGETLTLGFGGSYDLSEGDELVVVVESVQNPDSTGEYAVGLDINPQSSGGETDATLSLGSESGDGDTESSGDDATDSSGDGDTATDDGGDDSGDGSVSAPGFGAGLTVLALLGAAFVAVQRRD